MQVGGAQWEEPLEVFRHLAVVQEARDKALGWFSSPRGHGPHGVCFQGLLFWPSSGCH